jgi:phosphoribosylamine--glycine ligase
MRCNARGHYSRTCIAVDKVTKLPVKYGDGMIEKIAAEKWQPHMNWADLIVTTDNCKWLIELDVYRKKGFPVFSPSYESAQLELDRGAGQKLMQKCGLNVIPYEMFSDYKKAEAFVLAEKRPFVSKPNGDVRDKSTSYVGKSIKDMVYMLRRWNMTKKAAGEFMMQELVEGVEFSVAGWLGKNGFAKFFEEDFEHKRMMNDDYGPNTGEAGTVLKYVEIANSELAKEVLLPLESALIKMGHTGSVCVSVMVDDEGSPRPLEFTCRLGWPSFNTVQPLHPEPCEWMAHLIDGDDTFEPMPEVATGVVVTIPDWPHSKFTKKEVSGVPLWGMDDENEYRPFLSPCEVMSGVAPDDKGIDQRAIVSAGDYLVVANGIGETVSEASRAAYAAADSLEIPNNVQMRTDIGKRLKKDIPALQRYGFATEWAY